MNKAGIKVMIDKVETSLNETEQAASAGRGIINDVAALVVPMQRDQLAILREIANALPEEA